MRPNHSTDVMFSRSSQSTGIHADGFILAAERRFRRLGWGYYAGLVGRICLITCTHRVIQLQSKLGETGLLVRIDFEGLGQIGR